MLFFVLCMLSSQTVKAQNDFEQLYQCFRNAARFDHEFPREKVYLHFDNNAYYAGETIWFKAYVLRASSLKPALLSRVLYVELLNAEGQLIERKILKVDSLGQANGDFKLDIPISSGFYEIRAFTREMLNWESDACFSRVIPVFYKPDSPTSELEIKEPDALAVGATHLSRPFRKESRQKFDLSFYPEGGLRAADLEQRIAYKLTDNRGIPAMDTIDVCRPDGTKILSSSPIHEGMGSFVLPSNLPEGVYAKIGNQQFDLPQDSEVGYTMQAVKSAQNIQLSLSSTKNDPELKGLMVLCRDKVVYFDTLTLVNGILQYEIPLETLHGGVNRIELFNASGESLARRLVWKNAAERKISCTVKQNKKTYDAFQPIAMEIHLNDQQGNPVEMNFSMSVRDNGGILVEENQESIFTHLLLSSELKGYIHNPNFYFEKVDSLRQEALDLLLMIQGWSANKISTLCNITPFELNHHIEEKLTLKGQVFEANDKRKPRPNFQLNLQMYSFSGAALNGTTITDSLGRFAFESNVDYSGDFIATFTTKDEEGKKRWSRIAIDRWFAPKIRTYDTREMALTSPTFIEDSPITEEAPELFEWTDTIHRYVNQDLKEAVVVHKNRYRGFTGNRYTYNGGEKAGMKFAEVFYNIALETERAKDNGSDPGYIFEFMGKLDHKNEYNPTLDSEITYNTLSEEQESNSPLSDNHSEKSSNTSSNAPESHIPDQTSGENLSYETTFRRGATQVFINNAPPYRSMSDQPFLAEEFKSAVIMRNGSRSRHLVGPVDYSIKYIMVFYEWPDYYRYRSKKGIEKRRIQGFSKPREFYHPNYAGVDLPEETDRRRTLYWNPNQKSDKTGFSSAVFFNNSLSETKLRYSIRGISPQGEILSADW